MIIVVVNTFLCVHMTDILIVKEYVAQTNAL